MKYDARMLAKLALIFFGILFLVCIWLGRKERNREPLEGEKITADDAVILLQALDMDCSFIRERRDEEPDPEEEEPAYLTYGQYIQIREAVRGDAMGLPDYAGRYEEEDAMLKEDWYAAYRLMLAHLDVESSIWETTVFLLKVDADTGKAYTENGGLQSPYLYRSREFEKNILRQMKVYVKGSELLTVTEVLPGEYELKNVWVMESADGVLECFYHQIDFLTEADRQVERECVADLTFRDGKPDIIREKNDKVHGKLLRMTQEELEIEGNGVYRIAEGMEVYKLYGSLETKTRADLRIGYADTDFVVEKGQICAALISEEEAADRIRVLLKNTAKNSNYHDAVELEVDGERLKIQAEDLEIGERRTFRCAALTDKVHVYAEKSGKEDNAYRGVIECYRTEEGMVVVNELPLEEYLYAVVPSEMPASYPLEALKSQAVCARTYAYRYILHAGLPEVGAHVDDTTGYQVYHNISENAAATTAVKETGGMLLAYQGEPAQNYYYSTSCGVGTDAGIWKADSSQEPPYLQAVKLSWTAYEAAGSQEAAPDPADAEMLRDEETFFRFITSAEGEDLEKEEPWYRWNYTVDGLDPEAMHSRIRARYAASPASVLTKAEGDYYVSEPIEKLGKITDLSIVKRGAGGVVEELLIETDTGTYKILSEYNIRSVLCDGVSEVARQDGTTVVPGTLLPSGFFVLETGKKAEDVIGYTLTGGGYGHGVGMSQNGARALGEEGVPYQGILEFFFPGCELSSISHESGNQPAMPALGK